MKTENFVTQELFNGYSMKSKATQQINVKVSESDLRLIDEKAKRYGLSRSSLLKIFALNGELAFYNLDRSHLRMPIT
tara:strand:+ start:122 stop:352 length:231 start_codon:yes stop_codon:yes gene_type:complete